jgi:ferritin
MTAQLSNFLIADPEITLQNRLIFYVSTMESVTFPSEVNPKCKFCGDPNYVPPQPPAEESKQVSSEEAPKQQRSTRTTEVSSIGQLGADLLAKLTHQAQFYFATHLQYLQGAYWFEDRKLNGLAKHLKSLSAKVHENFRQTLDYLVLRGHQSEVLEPQVPKPEWEREGQVVASLLDREVQVYGLGDDAAKAARTEGDYDSERFVQSLLKEQVEALYKARRLLRQVESFAMTPGLIWWLNEQLD